MKLSKLWVAGFLAVAIAAVAMVAVACGSAEPEPAEPAMSTRPTLHRGGEVSGV